MTLDAVFERIESGKERSVHWAGGRRCGKAMPAEVEIPDQIQEAGVRTMVPTPGEKSSRRLSIETSSRFMPGRC